MAFGGESTLEFDHKAMRAGEVAAMLYYQQEACRCIEGLPRVGLNVDDGRAGREPWKLGAACDPGRDFVTCLMAQAAGNSKRKTKHLIGVTMLSGFLGPCFDFLLGLRVNLLSPECALGGDLDK